MIRNQGLNNDTSEEDVTWIRTHREKLFQFMESIKDQKFSVSLEGEMLNEYEHEMELRKDLEFIYDKHLSISSETVVECTICHKIFESKEFGIQHINQYHYEGVENDIKVTMELIDKLEIYGRSIFAFVYE